MLILSSEQFQIFLDILEELKTIKSEMRSLTSEVETLQGQMTSLRHEVQMFQPFANEEQEDQYNTDDSDEFGDTIEGITDDEESTTQAVLEWLAIRNMVVPQ